MEAVVFAQAIVDADATSRDAIGMVETLNGRGYQAKLVSAHAACREHRVHSLVDGLQCRGPRGLLLYHHALHFAGCERLIQSTRWPKILKYHNVTPASFFEGLSGKYASATAAGRVQTERLARLGFSLYLADSEFNAKELIECGADPDKCLVVPPFNHVDRLLAATPYCNLMRRCADEIVWLNVGRLAPNKDHDLLIRAFARFRKLTGLPSRLVIIGAEDSELQSYAEAIKRLVAALGLQTSVQFTGSVTLGQLSGYYRSADLYVCTSAHEGFCVPLVEAMALGLPIVAVSSTAIPETVDDAGVIVPQAHPDAIAAAASRVLCDKDLRQQVVLAGYQRYLGAFTNDAIAATFLDAIRPFGPPTPRAPVLPQRRLTPQNSARLAGEYIAQIRPCPDTFHGRGIVICAGGIKYLTCAWVLIKLLRRLGCRLPIQLWYRGAVELDKAWVDLVAPLDVEFIDAEKICEVDPHPRLNGWELKPYSMLHCLFAEVLLLDADNVPVADPTYLFDAPEYRETGAVFWPDTTRGEKGRECWTAFGVTFRDEPEQESGQVLIDKRRCWKALQLCNWYNENSTFYYKFSYGDKDTFRFAWHRLNQCFAMPSHPVRLLPYTLCQHDFHGRRIFQHRVHDKWSLAGNCRIKGFLHEDECFKFLDELRRVWRPIEHLAGGVTDHDLAQMETLSQQDFQLVLAGCNRWPLRLGAKGVVFQGWTRQIFFWWHEADRLTFAGTDGSFTATLEEVSGGVWEGQSLIDGDQRFQLVPQ